MKISQRNLFLFPAIAAALSIGIATLVAVVGSSIGFTAPKWLARVSDAPLAILGGIAFGGFGGMLIGLVGCAVIFGSIYFVFLVILLFITHTPVRNGSDS